MYYINKNHEAYNLDKFSKIYIAQNNSGVFRIEGCWVDIKLTAVIEDNILSREKAENALVYIVSGL